MSSLARTVILEMPGWVMVSGASTVSCGAVVSLLTFTVCVAGALSLPLVSTATALRTKLPLWDRS